MARLPQIPDVSFTGDITLAGLKQTALDEYRTAITEMQGVYNGIPDEDKAILYATAMICYQIAESLNKRARQNLLKYSEGKYLDNLAAQKPLERKEAACAIVKVRFILSAPRRLTSTLIPIGTRVTSEKADIYFATIEYAEIPAGDMYVDVLCIAQTAGKAGNDFDKGDLKILTDPIPYIASVANTEKPTGGANEESDDDFAERVYNSKNLYSTTGSEAAYIYYTKSYSTLIDDVYPTNPRDAEIVIYITMKDRELATESFLKDCQSFLLNPNIKPLTDQITVKNIERVNYKIDVEYTIYENDVSRLTEISGAITAAVEDYKTWQCAKIGRDINIQELISRIKQAGAAKVNIKLPSDINITKEQIAFCTDSTITYKGFIEE